jgi:hypothetical protein
MAVVDILIESATFMLSSLTTNQSYRIDIEQQSCRGSLRHRLRVKHVCFPERQIKRMRIGRILMQQVTQVCSR